MSGDLYRAQESGNFDAPLWNPLQCYLCNDQYKEPCILSCYHSFCMRCLKGKISDGQLVCPICGFESHTRDGEMPPSDQLLKFLVESSSTEKAQCANCDENSDQMFYCNTCSSPLCQSCREVTHRAKMFSKHEIVLLSKRSREIQKDCKVHGEPFILFSTEKKDMLCINCFRDMKIESRSHCVDMETAYKQGIQKLDHTMQSIGDLQSSVRDAILLLRVLIQEIRQNAETEKQAITTLYDLMQDEISQKKEALLTEVESQFEEKEESFKRQLASLSTLLPTLHVHLVTCSAFSASANKFEFLDLAFVIIQRLKALIQVQQPLHPTQGSQIFTDYKSQFAKCLEPLLFPYRNGRSNGTSSPRHDIPVVSTATSTNLPNIPALLPQNGGRRYSHNPAKYKFLEDKGYFSDHCKEFDDVHRELMQKVEKLKTSVQELQRDLTLRRCLAKKATVSDLDNMIDGLETSLNDHRATLEGKQPGLEQHWEEVLQKLAAEQEVYQAQLQDVSRLHQETQSVKTILSKLSSFVSSIASVTERIAPKLSTSVSDQDSQRSDLFEEINTMQPDSQRRVDAILAAQEERDSKTANRTNPLDEELIKTKGLLRAPSARKDSASRDPSRRESKELKEDVNLKGEKSPAKNDEVSDDGCSRIETEANLMTDIRMEEVSCTEGGNQDNDTKGHKQSGSKSISTCDAQNISEAVDAEGTCSQTVDLLAVNKHKDKNSSIDEDLNSIARTVDSSDFHGSQQNDINAVGDTIMQNTSVTEAACTCEKEVEGGQLEVLSVDNTKGEQMTQCETRKKAKGDQMVELVSESDKTDVHVAEDDCRKNKTHRKWPRK